MQTLAMQNQLTHFSQLSNPIQTTTKATPIAVDD